MLVIDSSALVKFFSKEEGWENVLPYIGEAMTMRFALAELGNSLLKKVHNDKIDLKRAEELLTVYSKNAVLLHDEQYTGLAFKTAHDNGLAMYDSISIAACKSEGSGLVTCDGDQAKVARKLGITVAEC